MASATATAPSSRIQPLRELGAYGNARWILLAGFVLASILEVLDTSIINPVLPTMAGNLGCTFQEIGWVSTSYILANVIVLPMTAWLATRFGLKRYMLVSIAMFIVSSALCGFATNLNEMILFRLIQGAAGAPLISMTQAALAEIFPKHEATLSQSIWALGITTAPALAPTLGGWITDNYAWPWIFYINIPTGLLSMYLIGRYYRGAGAQKGGTIDWLGIGLLTAGLGSIQYVLEEGQQNDWLADQLILKLTILGVVATLGFVLWQISPRNRSPVVDLRVLKDRGLSGATVVMFVAGFGLYGGLYLFPLFAQVVLGFTPLKSGLFMFAPGLFLAFTMMATGMMMQKKVPGRDLSMAGALIMMISMWMLGHMTSSSNESDAQLALDLSRIGIGLLMLSVIVAGVAGLKAESVKQGAALLGLARQLGGSFGIAALSTYVTRMTAFHRYDLAARMYSGNPLADDRTNMLKGALYAKGFDLQRAEAGAHTLLDGQITRQAYTMAVNNAHVLIGIMFALTIPCLLLMKRRAGGGDAAAAH
ncbi:DHA2 family efflux MFS transporter permease subunit [Fimbriimonas ginsengisoli]|uniref:Inner membrane component of tripartite multidrug resistance system n=1 Tax=Fimbriimonas ginsengisoli Gsoil 348 TaxID=661478 RepID=A0A068NLW9_FIMGI|nr:DHA2 family efflux MFS transporter permease subunit [Fimbriimonas ginsengisoli]AIE84412.1 Inner membrane component of tripartite multidrug resistance system [Fimbriimonas ginsengisoli Gsoil 348]